MKRFHYRNYLPSMIALLMFLNGCSNNSTSPGDDLPDPGNTITATISSPGSSNSFLQNTLINFSGNGTEGNSGNISADNLVWASDKDGTIGIGNAFNRSGLSINEHTIILTASSGSNTAMDTVLLTITSNANNVSAVIQQPAAGQQFFATALINMSGSGLAADGSDINNARDLEWLSDIDGVLGSGSQVSPGGLSPGQHTIQLIAADRSSALPTQFSTAALTLNIVAGPLAMVTADILAPQNGFILHPDSSITFVGSASNDGGQILALDDIIWTSSNDGEVGRGESCIVPGLSPGKHRITMTVTGHTGDKEARSIWLNVSDE